jgi:effector-binding domain-containing protein
MSKRIKKIVTVLVLLITGFLIWYLVIKPYDYLVTFKVNTTAGTINQSLKLWNLGLDDSSPIEQDNLNSLVQNININDTLYRYDWKISAINDSISKVNVYVTDVENSLQNKLTIPFSNTDFEKRTKTTITDFVEQLNDHLKKIKVTVVGESSTPSSYCAYVSIKETQLKKARGMMQNYSFLNSFLPSKGVTMNGPPFIEVTDWNMQNDSIAYNFCFPIIKSDSLPKHKSINYKQYTGVKAIKAIYNGNYMTSDRAWYALLEEAHRREIEVEETPFEVFYSNPNFGGNELYWKAEIFMPIKKR